MNTGSAPSKRPEPLTLHMVRRLGMLRVMLVSSSCGRNPQRHDLCWWRKSTLYSLVDWGCTFLHLACISQAVIAEAWSGLAEDEALVSIDVEREGPACGARSHGAAYKCGHQRRALGRPCLLEVRMHCRVLQMQQPVSSL